LLFSFIDLPSAAEIKVEPLEVGLHGKAVFINCHSSCSYYGPIQTKFRGAIEVSDKTIVKPSHVAMRITEWAVVGTPIP
jgi:hypothetical protein